MRACRELPRQRQNVLLWGRTKGRARKEMPLLLGVRGTAPGKTFEIIDALDELQQTSVTKPTLLLARFPAM
jgi:hypothetical protein